MIGLPRHKISLPRQSKIPTILSMLFEEGSASFSPPITQPASFKDVSNSFFFPLLAVLLLPKGCSTYFVLPASTACKKIGILPCLGGILAHVQVIEIPESRVAMLIDERALQLELLTIRSRVLLGCFISYKNFEDVSRDGILEFAMNKFRIPCVMH
jgi:hypothetical protein